jgi:hypothetical protein
MNSSKTSRIEKGRRVRRLNSGSGMRQHSSSNTGKTHNTAPAKIVNPLEVYAKQQLEEAKKQHAAWVASKPQRDAAEKFRQADDEKRMKKSELAAEKRMKKHEEKRRAMDDRMAALHAAYAKQKSSGEHHTLNIGGCAVYVRPEEECFFEDHHIPRPMGHITCYTCGRDKYPKLRHDPNNPVDETFPCFMCSEPLGWVYCCPSCSWHMRV